MDDNHQNSESEMELLMTMHHQMGRTPQFSATLCDFTELPSSSNGSKLRGYGPYLMENPQTGQGSSRFVKVESGVSTMNSSRKWPTTPLEKPVSSVEAMREMIFRVAVMQPIEIDPEAVKPPKRRNVKISKDPQSVAARHRREKISERIRTLQRLVPGGTKMDTASMLDEAVHYVKFLKTQVQSLEGYPVPVPVPVPLGILSSSTSSENETNYSSSTHYQLSQNSHPFHNSNTS